MSLMAAQFGLKVFYSEKNGGIVNLLKFLRDNKIPDDWVRWIDRNEFARCVGKDDPFSVFVSICWSFGNNRKAYLFGKDIENLKHLAFDVVVNQDQAALNQLRTETGLTLRMPSGATVNQRRLSFAQQMKKHIKFKSRIQCLTQIEVLSRLQQLEYLHVKFGDHDPDKVIIYYDPPYRGTAEYVDGGFNFKEFDEWFKNLPYTGFLSEYSAPFEKVASFGKMALLNNNSDKKKIVAENLYWNGK